MNFFESFRQGKYSVHDNKSKTQSARSQQNTFKVIHGKKAKVAQYQKLQKTKSDLYWKLSVKLQQQLKQTKNHNTPQARQKLFLLQKCRNQKHIRRKKREFINEYKQNIQPLTKTLTRPKTCCPAQTRCPSPDFIKRSASRQVLSRIENFNIQFERIKDDCVRENRKSQEIKEGIDTVNFYQKLITKNSSLIFTKML